ncbi:glutaredoxin family protein [Acidiferrobacter sp.]|uniref:glutaredoxin family protein n=1 Tax=Acidiferrobacter sp. TaxID=1872107 RepID=UPI002624EBC9|nr:glutaredoxin family protein [Acidiferrobacter sp.]
MRAKAGHHCREEHRTIDLYTSPGCPDCAALKAWFTAHNVVFAEHDLSAPGAADKAKAAFGVRIAPITVYEGQVFYGTAEEQLPRLKRLLGVM